MYSSSNFRGYSPKTILSKAKSTDNFYKRATEHSIKYQSTNQSTDECLACKHEKDKSLRKITKEPLKTTNIYTTRKNGMQQYYKTNDKQELNNLRKAKRFLEQLLDHTKIDFKKTVTNYENKVRELTQQVKEKDQKLYQLQKQQHQKEAEQYYLSNASLVQTYQKVGKKEENEEAQSRKYKELIRIKEELENQLENVYRVAAERQNKLEGLELELARIKECEINQRQYQSMKLLIGKMEEEKLQLLDRHHSQIQQIQSKNQEDTKYFEDQIEEMSRKLELKGNLLLSRQAELQELKDSISKYKNQQFEALRELLDERQKECLSLESRLNCIQSELSFVRGRYGYVLRLAQQGELLESRVNEPQEFCVERVGRHQLSNGKDSLLGMNLSPIKHRQINKQVQADHH